MKGRIAGLSVVIACCVVPLTAQAGWILQLRSTAISNKGERQPAEESTMYVSEGKTRIVQPGSTTVVDYKNNRFTLINQNKGLFWTGTVDEYISEMGRNRQAAANERFGNSTAAQMIRDPQKPDADAPKIVVRKLGTGGAIAGHETVKYQIESNGELFQEVWVAENLDLTSDLDPRQYLTVQQKLSDGMIGKSGRSFRAMWKNHDVRVLHEKGFIVQNVIRHVAGGFERVTTAVRRADVADSEFEVPESYRRVRLSDVLKGDKAS
jgi:hypothetical protein